MSAVAAPRSETFGRAELPGSLPPSISQRLCRNGHLANTSGGVDLGRGRWLCATCYRAPLRARKNR